MSGTGNSVYSHLTLIPPCSSVLRAKPDCSPGFCVPRAPPPKTRFMTISSCVDDGVCICQRPGHERVPTHSPMGNVVAHVTFRRKRGNQFWELSPRVCVSSHGARARERKDSRHREAGRLDRPLCPLERARRDQGDWILSNRWIGHGPPTFELAN